MKMIHYILLLTAGALISACSNGQYRPTGSDKPAPITENASSETKALYRNLSHLSSLFLLFGHEDTTAYGVHWMNEPGRSDIKDITGSYPAIFGWDIGHLETGDETNLDGVEFALIRDEIKASYSRGSISTISWHMRDPVTGGTSWDKSPSVAKLIPGGEEHEKLKQVLDTFAEFNRTLTATDAEGNEILVPIIFRPWHEHNGNWFWWGKGENLTTEQDYIALWRFTVDYLRHEKKLTNLIYAFSPDRSRMDIDQLPESYFYGYPGDDYVDIIGLDNYMDLGYSPTRAGANENVQNLRASLAAIGQIAQEKGKVAALTEGGQETIPQSTFWTDTVLASVLANSDTRSVAYIMVWRNANREKEGRDHYYAPYKGHESEANFLKFYQHPATLFESDLPNLYQ